MERHAKAGKESIHKELWKCSVKFLSSNKWMPKDLVWEPLWRNMDNVIKIA